MWSKVWSEKNLHHICQKFLYVFQDIFKFFIKGKNLFYRNLNPSHSPLYPDVLKIKTVIVVKQKFHLFITMVNKSLIWPPNWRDIPAAVWPEMDLWTIFLNKQMAFLFHNNYCFYFQNIWTQLLMWRIVTTVKQIFG